MNNYLTDVMKRYRRRLLRDLLLDDVVLPFDNISHQAQWTCRLMDLLLSDGNARYATRVAANSVNIGFMKARHGPSVKPAVLE